MALMVSYTQVNNFDTWQPGFHAAEALRNQSGISNPRIFRSVKDGNDVVILFDVRDADEARTFLTSDRAREAMKNIGVVSGPRLTFFT
jgi:hypothetical protein